MAVLEETLMIILALLVMVHQILAAAEAEQEWVGHLVWVVQELL